MGGEKFNLSPTFATEYLHPMEFHFVRHSIYLQSDVCTEESNEYFTAVKILFKMHLDLEENTCNKRFSRKKRC